MEFTRGKKGSGGLDTSKFSAADKDDDEDEEEIDAPKPDSDGAETITIGDHTAVFKGYRLTKDDEGRDAMVLTYDYTNGGEEEQSFAWAFFYEATQDGESLPSPWYEENGEQMVENYEEKVQPGETLEVKIAIGLVNTSDEVTIVFSDLMDEETCTQTIQLPGGGTSKPDKEPEEEPDEEPDGPTMQADDAWRGDWYGWWIITYASGSWEETEGSWSDCCATVTRDGDAGDITIWDEVFTKDAPLVECQVSFGPGTTAAGAMMSEDGLFIDGPIAHADWIIDPGASAVSQYERMLEIEGTYEDPEEEGAGFDYVIYLRPWGMDWEDVAAADESLLPAYYTDWYLPLIEAGEPMPDTIGD